MAARAAPITAENQHGTQHGGGEPGYHGVYSLIISIPLSTVADLGAPPGDQILVISGGSRAPLPQ